MTITYEPRMLSGRCANGAQRDGGKLVHAMYAPARDFDTAVCGAQPGHSSGAGFCKVPEGRAVTCPKCLARMTKPRPMRLSPATVALLRDVAAGRGGHSCPDIAENVRREINRHGLLKWESATEARLKPAGVAALALLDEAGK